MYMHGPKPYTRKLPITQVRLQNCFGISKLQCKFHLKVYAPLGQTSPGQDVRDKPFLLIASKDLSRQHNDITVVYWSVLFNHSTDQLTAIACIHYSCATVHTCAK